MSSIKVWQLGVLLIVAMLFGAKAQKDGGKYVTKVKEFFGMKTTPTTTPTV